MSHKNAIPLVNIVVFQIGVVFDWFVVAEEVIAEPRRRGIRMEEGSSEKLSTCPTEKQRTDWD